MTRTKTFIAAFAAALAFPAAASANCSTMQGSFAVTCEKGVQVYRHKALSSIPKGLSPSQVLLEREKLRAGTARRQIAANSRAQAMNAKLSSRALAIEDYRARVYDRNTRRASYNSYGSGYGFGGFSSGGFNTFGAQGSGRARGAGFGNNGFGNNAFANNGFGNNGFGNNGAFNNRRRNNRGLNGTGNGGGQNGTGGNGPGAGNGTGNGGASNLGASRPISGSRVAGSRPAKKKRMSHKKSN